MPHILSNHAVLLAGGQGGGQEYAAGDNINITDHVISGKDWTSTIESAVSGKADYFSIGQNLMIKSDEYFSAILDLKSTGCTSEPYSYAIAVGKNNYTDNNSIVAGDSNYIHGYNSIVFGRLNSANQGSYFAGSLVGGQDSYVNGENNASVGREIRITGGNNAVFGYGNTINGSEGFLVGRHNNAVNGKYILGEGNKTNNGIIIGFNCSASASNYGSQEVPYILGGYQNSAEGEDSVIVGGRWNNLNGNMSFIVGSDSTVIGDWSVAVGYTNDLSSDGMQGAFGDTNTLRGWVQYAYGKDNELSGEYQATYGTQNTGTSAGIESISFGHRNLTDAGHSYIFGRENEIHGEQGQINNYAYGYSNSLNGTTSAIAVGFNNSISNVTGAIAVGEQLSPGQDEMHIGFGDTYIKITKNGDVYKMIDGVQTPWADLTAGVYSAGQNIDITNYVVSGRDWSTEIAAATGNIIATINNNFELNGSNKITGYNGTAFEVGGGSGPTYTAGQNINITNNIISGKDWSSDILAGMSGKEDKITYTYSNNKITALNGSAIAQKEYSGVAPISINNSTNQISLAQSAMNVLTSFAGKYNLKAGNGISFRLVGNDVYIDAT